MMITQLLNLSRSAASSSMRSGGGQRQLPGTFGDLPGREPDGMAVNLRHYQLLDLKKAAELGIRVTPPARSAERLAGLAELYAQGKLRFHVHRVFPLAAAAEAHRTYKAGGIRGKIVLTMEAYTAKRVPEAAASET